MAKLIRTATQPAGPGESLAVYAFRLAALLEDKDADADQQVSDDLRRKLMKMLSSCTAVFVRRQLRYGVVNDD